MNWPSLLLPGLRRHWRWLVLGSILIILSLMAATVLLGLSGWFISASALAGLGLIVGLDIFTPGAGIRLAAITRTLARYGERVVTHEATFRLLAEVRLGLLCRLLRLEELQLRGIRRGDTLNRLTADVDTLDHLFTGIFGPMIAAIILALAVAGAFVLFDADEAGGVVIGLLVMQLLLLVLAGTVGRRSSRKLADMAPDQRTLSTGGLDALETLIAYDRIDHWRDRIARHCDVMIKLDQKLARRDAVGHGLATLLGLLGLWLVLVIALMLYQDGTISGPVAVLLGLVMLGLGEAWQPLPAAWRRLSATRISLERIQQLAGMTVTQPGPGYGTPFPKNKSIEVNDITYCYSEFLPPLFHRFNIIIAKGERIAISGPSGGGKTTLALLLTGQITPQRGSVRIGGVNLNAIDPDELRRRIGYLPQRPVLFRDSLAANLRLADPDASDDRLAGILDSVGLGGFLERLPRGLETWLDERSSNVSGGEIKRIALARLMLTEPDIVILDEPTIGLDAASADAMRIGIDYWLTGRTVVMISHEPDRLPEFHRQIHIQPATTA